MWIFEVLPLLSIRCDGGFSRGRWQLHSFPNIVTGVKFQENVLEFGSVHALVQKLCHGICQAQSCVHKSQIL